VVDVVQAAARSCSGVRADPRTVAVTDDVGEAETEERVRFAVRLFLDGVRRRR
jgi:hypothetical protein